MIHTLRPLKRYRDEIRLDLLAPEIREAWRATRGSAHWTRFHALQASLKPSDLRALSFSLMGEGLAAELAPSLDMSVIRAMCEALIPWRVGPFELGDLRIDSEWCSGVKFSRIAPLLGSVHGKRIADVGCSNGYFLFRLSPDEPEVALGFDPVDRCWLQFSLLQLIFGVPSLGFVPVGISSLDAFPEFFDLILCMGVIYHQRDPFTACKRLYQAVRPGGRILLESLVIDQPGSHLLIPTERYAKMRNAWIVPTPDALATLCARAGFSDIEIHRFGPITTSEQRRTPWAPYESLADFLDPHDASITIEGYPAPHSAAVTAIRR